MNLWKHQQETIEKALSLGHLALLQDPGVGKTLSTIKICEGLWKDRVKKTVIFCPKAVVGNWKKEFDNFSEYGHLVFKVEGDINKRLKTLRQNMFNDSVFVLNYEAIQNKNIQAALNRFGPEILILDESHRCKNPSSKRAKAVTALADKVEHKFILTGTPILSSSMDLFQQFRILDGGKTFGMNFFAFRHKYFEDKNAGWAHSPKHFPEWVPRKGVEEEFNELVSKVSYKVRKEDCLDLPPLLHKEIDVPLCAQQRDAYKTMQEECIAFIKDEEKDHVAVAEFALHRVLRLQQIVCGFAKTEDDKIVRFNKNPRLDMLKDLVEDIAPYEKVIIWANFVANQDDICMMLDKMKINYRTLFGRTADKQKEINDFQDKPEVRVMVANQSAGGVGVNLQAASTAIYYSKGFSLEHDIQSVARCYRGGSEIHDKITRIDLIARDTIDEVITKSLKAKEEIGNRILDYMRGL